MKNKLLTFFLALFLIISGVYVLFLIETEDYNSSHQTLSSSETAYINNILIYIEDHYSNLNQTVLKEQIQGHSLTVVNADGRVLFTTESIGPSVDLFEYANNAMNEHALLYPLTVNHQIAGIAVFRGFLEPNDFSAAIHFATVLYLGFLLSLLVMVLFIFFKIIRPFQDIREFTKKLAKGHLDVPLKLKHVGGLQTLTENLDLMREELKKAKEQEAKANKDKKQLVAQLSHDIKTPIASIKACAEILRENITGLNKEKYLSTIGKKVEEIDLLMTDLLTSTVEDLQELKFNIREYYSGELFSGLLQDLETVYPQKIHLITEIPNVLISTDVMRIKQVITNIITNSVKYAMDSPIDIRFEKEAEYLVVSFHDYGNGVSDKDLPYLFKQFFRGENAIENHTVGAGLGLYIAYIIMEKTDGFITVQNDNGFTVSVGILLI